MQIMGVFAHQFDLNALMPCTWTSKKSSEFFGTTGGTWISPSPLVKAGTRKMARPPRLRCFKATCQPAMTSAPPKWKLKSFMESKTYQWHQWHHGSSRLHPKHPSGGFLYGFYWDFFLELGAALTKKQNSTPKNLLKIEKWKQPKVWISIISNVSCIISLKGTGTTRLCSQKSPQFFTSSVFFCH